MAPALRKLAADLADPGVVDHLVKDYVDLLDDRVEGIGGDLGRVDVDHAMVTALSLETSSALIGATDVVEAARDVRAALEHDRLDHAAQHLHRLRQRAATVRGRLAALGFRIER